MQPPPLSHLDAGADGCKKQLNCAGCLPEEPTITARTRSYAEGCLAAHALDLIGDRWALLVVRELMLGPRRFGSLRADLPGIASNILTTRLEALEAGGIATRTALPDGAPGWALTPAGLGLGPVIDALCRWGAAMPGHDPRLPISATALMLSMRAQMRPGPARAGGDREAAFRMGADGFTVTIRDGRHHVARGDAPQAEVMLAGHPNALAATVYGPQPLRDSIARGLVAVTGDLDRAQGFIDLFSLQADEGDPP